MKKRFVLLLCALMAIAVLLTSCAAPSVAQSVEFDVNSLRCMIDLHLHLDGAISVESAKMLAMMQGIEIPKSEEELLSLMRVAEDCSDLNEFLEKFAFPCTLLQTKEGIRQATLNLLNELEEQGVMYAEIRFAPQLSTDKGLTQSEAVLASLDGMKEAGIRSNLILCCMRGDDTNTREANSKTVREAEQFLGKGVVAIDLAGAEALFPTSDFEDIFALASEKSIPFTIHAGEADGAESVRTALSFGASRIGHGVRAVEDNELLKELAAKEIPLELCPTSNVCTAAFKTIADWPLEELMYAGVVITINTDDPSIEGTSIKEEYQKLIDNFGIGKEEVKEFLLNAVNASFADASLKREMIAKINAEISA